MRIIRWLLTISFIGIALFLALLLGILLLGVYLAMRVTGALKVKSVRVDEQGRVVTSPPQGRGFEREAMPQRRASAEDLPLAPAGAEIFHMRAWDEAQNRAVDRWYYRDDNGQWIFVRQPVTT
ncbi:MAG: hypothetical protein ACRCTD_01875 [Beijerinckiaceae bacterium]